MKASFSRQVDILKAEGVLWRQRDGTLSDAFAVPRVPRYKSHVDVVVTAVSGNLETAMSKEPFVGEPQESAKALTC
jgi:hypothetical protein